MKEFFISDLPDAPINTPLRRLSLDEHKQFLENIHALRLNLLGEDRNLTPEEEQHYVENINNAKEAAQLLKTYKTEFDLAKNSKYKELLEDEIKAGELALKVLIVANLPLAAKYVSMSLDIPSPINSPEQNSAYTAIALSSLSSRPWRDIEDRMQVASEALVRAASKYTLFENIVFSEFAGNLIRKALIKYCNEHEWGSGWHVTQQIQQQYIEHSKGKIERPQHNQPMKGMGKRWVGLHPDVVHSGQESTSMFSDERLTYTLENTAVNNFLDPHQAFIRKKMVAKLYSVLVRNLSNTEIKIIALYWGLQLKLDGTLGSAKKAVDCRESFDAISDYLKIDIKSVKRNFNKAMDKLKQLDQETLIELYELSEPIEDTHPEPTLSHLAQGAPNARYPYA